MFKTHSYIFAMDIRFLKENEGKSISKKEEIESAICTLMSIELFRVQLGQLSLRHRLH